MHPQTRKAIRQITTLTGIQNPYSALEYFIADCKTYVVGDWLNYVTFRCLICYGHIHDPEVDLFTIAQVEEILGTRNILDFMAAICSGPTADRTVEAVRQLLDSGEVDCLVLGAIGAIIRNHNYHQKIDPNADQGTRGCIGVIFGMMLQEELTRARS